MSRIADRDEIIQSHLARIPGAISDQVLIESADEMQQPTVRDRRSGVVSAEKNLPTSPAEVIQLEQAREAFVARAEWDGYVTEVEDAIFRAVLTSVLKPVGAEQDVLEAEIDAVQPVDRHRVVPGALFRLSTGKYVRERGRQDHLTRFYFRLPINDAGSQCTTPDVAEPFDVAELFT